MTRSSMETSIGYQVYITSIPSNLLLGFLDRFEIGTENIQIKVIISAVLDSDTDIDEVLSFEKLEAARWAPCLKKGGTIIVNTQEIDPMPVITGAAEYPSGILEELKSKGVNIDAVDALSLAQQAGSAKAVNIVLMARFAKHFTIPVESWENAIAKTVAPKFIDMNRKAFELGYEA